MAELPTILSPFATPPCPVCVRASVVHLDREDVERYKAGEHAQDVWPDKTDDERELIITGTHPECWAQMFPDEEEDDGTDSHLEV